MTNNQITYRYRVQVCGYFTYICDVLQLSEYQLIYLDIVLTRYCYTNNP